MEAGSGAFSLQEVEGLSAFALAPPERPSASFALSLWSPRRQPSSCERVEYLCFDDADGLDLSLWWLSRFPLLLSASRSRSLGRELDLSRFLSLRCRFP